MLKACVFLGNPGRQYEKTRHNAGWMTADMISLLAAGQWKEKFSGLYLTLNRAGRQQLFLKPLTLMNLSGRSVRKALDFYKLEPSELLCVHDDLETAFGTIAVKKGGGLGGHNGLKSLKEHLGSSDFCRLKIGISRPSKGSVSSYVLQRFSPDEEAVLPRILERVAGLVETLLDADIIQEEKIQVL